jgi:hypothetical protein
VNRPLLTVCPVSGLAAEPKVPLAELGWVQPLTSALMVTVVPGPPACGETFTVIGRGTGGGGGGSLGGG